MTNKYNFYNFISLIINSKSPAYLKYFDYEYLRLSNQNSLAKVQITLNIVNSLPPPKAGDVIKKVTFKKIFPVSYLIRDYNADGVEIYFKGHWFEKIYLKAISVFVQTELLEPLIFLKLLEQNILLMHCAGVSDDKYGYIFPAQGGTGKTTLSLKLCNLGYRLLGDDLIIINPLNKKAFPYPRPLHLFSYNIKTLENAKISLKLKLAIIIKDFIRRILSIITKQKFLISTRIDVKELYPKIRISESVEYKKFIFLTKSGPNQVKQLKAPDKIAEVTNDLIEAADLNKSLNTIFKDDPAQIQQIKKLESSVVENIVKSLNFINYVNIRETDLKAIIEILKNSD